jgi:hypothetical protein
MLTKIKTPKVMVLREIMVKRSTQGIPMKGQMQVAC